MQPIKQVTPLQPMKMSGSSTTPQQSIKTGQGLLSSPSPMQPLKKGPEYIDDRFIKIQIVGKGAYGEVYKVKHRETGKIYAMKTYKNIFCNRVLALRTLR